MGKTSIPWTVAPGATQGYTFNAWYGCAEKPGHPGCANCFARAIIDTYYKRAKWGPADKGGSRTVTTPEYWLKPISWDKRAAPDLFGPAPARPRVLCNSMADVFEDFSGRVRDHEGNPIRRDTREPVPPYGVSGRKPFGDSVPLTVNDLRADLFRLIDLTPNLDWLLLTKYPENLSRFWLTRPVEDCSVFREAKATVRYARENVWLGYSASDQRTLNNGWPLLARAAGFARLVFLNLEPILAPVDLTAVFASWSVRPAWVIVGGESGPEARETRLEDVTAVVDQCKNAGVPCYVKGLGDRPTVNAGALGSASLYDVGRERLHDAGRGRLKLQCMTPKGEDPDEWPSFLRVRGQPKLG